MSGAVVDLAPSAAGSVLACGYVWLAARDGRRWPVGRTLLFLAGAAVLTIAVSPPVDRLADHDFGGHAAQHLLLAMVAPLGLALGAPVTLLLRGLPHAAARRLGRALHTAPIRLLARPSVALLLSSGGLVLLYFTPLYDASTRDPVVHALVHLHLLASGLLFAWVIAGPDPAPVRASVPARLVVLGVAVAVHAVVSQLLFAGILVQVHEPVGEMQAAGNLMYVGGDVAEVLLALALLLTWRRGGDGSRRRRTAGSSPRVTHART
ncbi:cytochrome c oxidase assembly protein [Nocardioides sp. URHA0020]|uniref:cytochrome c oxidase assembly protein n=1 Tax=Nocardioides sp. URHA0020 TaxID=1380392 RepID=UPI000685C1F3|nr:cytochrome c oxidase assembly protein [Nocardioides sp. URHA0020]